MPEPYLLAAIRADPDDGPRWLALALWFADNGRDDEAAAVRVFWRTLGDRPRVRRSIEAVLADVRRNASILARAPGRSKSGPTTADALGPARAQLATHRSATAPFGRAVATAGP
jgi:uncharacterized protein (TIGR02996 family)